MTRRAKDVRDAGAIVGIAIPGLAELLFGAEYSHAPDANRQRIMRAVAKWPVWTFDRAAAAKYGVLAAELKRRGRPMQQNDIQIAAIALTLGNCIVVSKDVVTHFQLFSNTFKMGKQNGVTLSRTPPPERDVISGRPLIVTTN